MAWASGQRLQGGKYTIEQELGLGGFGITYLARDKNGRQVVIKTLNDRLQSHSDFAKFQQDFLNEALRLAKCNHRYIVRIDEVIQEETLWGIVIEYIDGEDLGSRVENQGVLAEAEALRYIQQIGEALTVVHDNGLLYRDVKPTNIMLRSGKSEAVLIDFGIAREFTPNLTQTHTQMLPNGFAPIEQYDKRAKRGAYTDVYALAATLYSLLTREVPTLAPLRATGMPLEEPKQINPSISDRINQAILKGMEVNAGDRPQSVQEWLKLLGIGFAPNITSVAQSSPVIPINPSSYYQSLSQAPSVPLISTQGVDYSKLRDLLADGKWQEADEETLEVMLYVAIREEDYWLDVEDIENFPCEDLRTIDQLWGKYSNGRFVGFSAQKLIWERVGGTLNADYKMECRFGKRVGWLVHEDWLYSSCGGGDKLTFNTTAPLGHLPGLWLVGGDKWGWDMGRYGDRLGAGSLAPLSSRLVICNIQ